MRGLYIALGNNFLVEKIKYNSSNGIANKIYYQLEAFKGNGIDVDFYNPYFNRNHRFYKIERRLPLAFLHKWAYDMEQIKLFDFIYVRKPWFMDGDLVVFLSKAKRINSQIKIILEIPTYPYDKELGGIKSLPLVLKDKYWRKKMYKYVDRIATYSRDESIFNIPTIRISNAIDFKNQKRIINQNIMNPNELNIIACSSLAYWHGYDRAIYGLKEYVENEDDFFKIHLHIVGDGEEKDKYIQLVQKFGLEEYVTFYGALSGENLNNIYSICQIGLDSLGRHRSGVYYNSSLKGKEYCAKGLVIVSGVQTELDYEKEYEYYLKIPSDDSPLNFNNIIDFYSNLINKKDIKNIQEEIMLYAKEHFDYSIAIKPIIDFLNQVREENN
jgi:glycosyltransferase involved in cell wall biosynthesis